LDAAEAEDADMKDGESSEMGDKAKPAKQVRFADDKVHVHTETRTHTHRSPSTSSVR
jgi:hypothetical protein